MKNLYGKMVFIELPTHNPMPYFCVGESDDEVRVVAMRSGMAAYTIQQFKRSDITILFAYEDKGHPQGMLDDLEQLLADDDCEFSEYFMQEAENSMKVVKQVLNEKKRGAKVRRAAPEMKGPVVWNTPAEGSLAGKLVGIQKGTKSKMLICLSESGGSIQVVSPEAADKGRVAQVNVAGKDGWAVFHEEPGEAYLQDLIEELASSSCLESMTNASALRTRVRKLFAEKSPEVEEDNVMISRTELQRLIDENNKLKGGGK